MVENNIPGNKLLSDGTKLQYGIRHIRQLQCSCISNSFWTHLRPPLFTKGNSSNLFAVKALNR